MSRARRITLYALLVLAIGYGACLELVIPCGPSDFDSLIREAAVRLSYAAAAAAMVGLFGCRLPPASLCPRGLRIGAVALILAVALQNFPFATLLAGRAAVTAPPADVLALALACLATALYEELLFRALLLPLFTARLGGTRRTRFAALLGSSAVFGAFHLLNLAAGAAPGATLLQVGYSFLIGCAAAALCCLLGKLWPAVLFHALYNFGGYLVPRLGHGPLYDVPTVVVTVLLSLGCAACTAVALWVAFAPLQKK